MTSICIRMPVAIGQAKRKLPARLGSSLPEVLVRQAAGSRVQV
jgi:hypothetical protein